MNPLRRISPLLALALSVPLLSSQGTESPANRKLLQQARDACYNLRARGLVSFQGGMEPDWGALLADARKENPEGIDRAVKMLEAIHFQLSLAPDNSVKVTHDAVQAPNEQSAKGLAQVYGGMEQMTQGFFQTWGTFLLHHPFPDQGVPYRLTAAGEQYQISYKDGGSSVVTLLGKDLRIISIKSRDPESDSLLQPQFEATPQGLLLIGYLGDYQNGKPEEATHLQVGIRYTLVDGLQLPSELIINGSYGGSPIGLKVRFVNLKAVLK